MYLLQDLFYSFECASESFPPFCLFPLRRHVKCAASVGGWVDGAEEDDACCYGFSADDAGGGGGGRRRHPREKDQDKRKGEDGGREGGISASMHAPSHGSFVHLGGPARDIASAIGPTLTPCMYCALRGQV